MEEKENQFLSLLKTFYNGVIMNLISFFSIREGVDIEGTSTNIKNDVTFKGHSVWILIFSIFIASIGLNTNSIPIIIGAMLISPLMGPILGIGLSLGTIDIQLLQKSLKNLLVAVFVSILTSYIYFKLTPFQDERPEILARTQPQLFDVLIALFGGLSGIIASSRRERSNVIPGVAIATALMPPLCTAGYGLATGNFDYFLGAFYLFTLNAAGITVTTLIVVRYIGFPKVQFLNKKRQRNIKFLIWVFSILLIVPSAISFYSVLQKDIFDKRLKSFIDKELVFDHTFLIKNKITEYKDSTKTIELYFYGELLDSSSIEKIQSEFYKYGINNSELVFNQGKDNKEEFLTNVSEVKNNYSNLIENTNKSLMLQNAKLDELEGKLDYYIDTASVVKLNDEVKILFPRVIDIAFGKMSYLSDSNTIFLLTTYNVNVKKKYRSPFDEEKLRKWFKYKNTNDSISVNVKYLK